MNSSFCGNDKIIRKEVIALKALKYEISVYEGIVDFTHGFNRIIEEIFIPETEIVFNVIDGKLNVFSASELRSEKGQAQEITVDPKLVENLQTLVKLKDECLTKARTYF